LASSRQDSSARLLAQVAAEPSPPAAGPATSLTLALAAGLAELTAAVAGEDELATRARALREGAAAIGAEDAAAYAELLRAGQSAREHVIELPARMASLAGEIGDVAASAVERGRPDSRYDAAAGALLAAGAARSAALLVEANLRGAPDRRLDRSREAVDRADAAARRALAAAQKAAPRREG
jgi:formiminotetrahydrofolate cyclodeaminase